MILLNAMLKSDALGPRSVFLPTSPNYPASGTTKAEVLNHCATVGLGKSGEAPVAFARNVPFVPRFTSVKLPRTRAVNGSPEARLHVPLHCQPASTPARCGTFARNRLSRPKGSSQM